MIQKRGGKWGVRIYRDGKQEWVGTFPTLREARAAEREAVVRTRPTRDESVAEYVERWKVEHARKRASTNRHNAYMVRGFVEHFGDVLMADVPKAKARAWVKTGKNRSALPVLRALFYDALEDEVVTENPFANPHRWSRGERVADPSAARSRAGRRDLVALTQAEVHGLADTALMVLGTYGPTFRACVLFCAYVGLRPAEMFVLEWSDIDFLKGEVRITKSLGSTGEVTLPKNDKHRVVTLPLPAADALRSLPRRADSPYVFTTSTGLRFSKTSHYYYWKQLRAGWTATRDEADRERMEGMDFYELRHFCATELLRRRVTPWDVAVQLGHTDGGALVMTTYGHPEEEDARDRLRAAYASGGRLRAV